MNSSPKAPEHAREPLLVAEGGIPYVPSQSADPYLAWMDLMEAVEALCPQWPERSERMAFATFIL